ncbi:MAG: ABC transporter ATP-binding protein [Gemmatimonadota bacterium]|jgi:ABC-2 type transport system ATP-binding protein|nr:ABC transporter ATP-binding protein [Gemmatimonadota bacterium]
MMIELSDVTKSFAGPWYRGGTEVQALDRINLSVDENTALGVVGLNGAGKSTLIRILLGYARPSSGEARISGLPAREYVERHGIGYVPERLTIPRQRTVRDALRACAALDGGGSSRRHQVDAVIDRFGLTSLADRRVGTLSKGNLQRVGIAQAILGDRQLLVLDEPTDGLDPVWVAELRGILTEWRAGAAGRTLILASHNLTEVARLTDRVLLLHNGRIRDDFASREVEPDLESHFLDRVRALEEGRV